MKTTVIAGLASLIFFTGFQTVAGERAGKWEVYFVGQQMRGQELTNARVSVNSLTSDRALAAFEGLTGDSTEEEIDAAFAAWDNASGITGLYGLAETLTGIDFSDPDAAAAFADEQGIDLGLLSGIDEIVSTEAFGLLLAADPSEMTLLEYQVLLDDAGLGALVDDWIEPDDATAADFAADVLGTGVSASFDLEDAGVYGIGAGYHFTDQLSLNTEIMHGSADLHATLSNNYLGQAASLSGKVGEMDMTFWNVNAEFAVLPDTVVTPIFGAGLGFNFYDAKIDGVGSQSDSEFTYNLGVGLRADYEQFVGKVMYRATWTDIDGFDKLKQDGVSVGLGIKF